MTVCSLYVQESEQVERDQRRMANIKPHACFQKGKPDEESETWSPFIFITERQSALTLPVQPLSLSISLSHISTRQGRQSDKPKDR